MKIVGIGVCGPGEADNYLKETLETFKRLCDDVLIVLNNADLKSMNLIRSYGFTMYQDNREWGIHQPRIKEDLVKHAGKFAPDWILSLDMDESFPISVTRDDLEKLMKKDEVGYLFYFIQKWNDEQHVMPGLHFWDLRLFRYRRDLGFKFERKPVHCGMGPKWAYTYGFYAPHIIIHRGLMRPEVRKKKVERYEKYDPNGVWNSKDYYNALASDAIGVPYNEAEEIKKVAEEISKYGNRIMPEIVPEKRVLFHRVLRVADGAILEIPSTHVEDTINQGGRNKYFKDLGPVAEIDIPEAEAPVVIPPAFPEESNPEARTVGELECIECGFVAKSKLGLTAHGRKHNKDK